MNCNFTESIVIFCVLSLGLNTVADLGVTKAQNILNFMQCFLFEILESRQPSYGESWLRPCNMMSE